MLGPTKFWVQKNFGPKSFDQKNSGSIRFFGPKIFLTCSDMTCPDFTSPNLCPDLTCIYLTCPDLITLP